MSNTFVEFVSYKNGIEVADFTRDGYRTVFVSVNDPEPETQREMVEKAKTEGYYYHGPATNLENDAEVEVFSVDDADEFELPLPYVK